MPSRILTIMVIEQDRVQCDLMNLALQQIKCQVHILQGGQEALEQFAGIRPDLVLVDLFLKQMSGLEVIARIKEKEYIHPTRIIAVSSMGFPDVMEQAKEAGACDFIVKPFESELLLQRIQKALL